MVSPDAMMTSEIAMPTPESSEGESCLETSMPTAMIGSAETIHRKAAIASRRVRTVSWLRRSRAAQAVTTGSGVNLPSMR